MCRFGAEDVGQVLSGHVREFHGRAAGREKQADHQKQLDIALTAVVQRYQRKWFPEVKAGDAASALGSEMMSLLPSSCGGACSCLMLDCLMLDFLIIDCLTMDPHRLPFDVHQKWSSHLFCGTA